MKQFLLCISLFLLVGMTSNSRLYAQEEPLDRALNYVPFSDFPYKDKYTTGRIANIGFDSRFPAKMYDDFSCKKYTWAVESVECMPYLYLKISLPDKSILGALSFGGVTAYRTDLLFMRER